MKYCLDCNKPKSNKGNYCKEHGYSHRTRPSGLTYKLVKVNSTTFKKGHKSWNENTIKLDFDGKSYDGIHTWVERILGLAKNGECEKCNSSNNLQWSNKSSLYLADISDWQRLCTKCHARYDYENFGARKEFYT